MTSPDSFQLFRLFQRAAPAALFRELCQKHGYGSRLGIYSASVVVWLMIWQRLQGNRSLTAAVQYLLQCEVQDLHNNCQRRSQDNVSAATGSYCQARQKLPKLIVSEVAERIVEQLRVEMQEGWEGLMRPVFVIDGSALQLQHTPELKKAYSPGHNQHGENQWPMMR